MPKAKKEGEGGGGGLSVTAQPRPRLRQQQRPPPRRANLLFVARADRALLSRTSLVILGLHAEVLYVADEPSKHSGRIGAAELFNGSKWSAVTLSSASSSSSSEENDGAPPLSWLGSPSALLEGTRVSSSSSPVTLPISIADPKLRGVGVGAKATSSSPSSSSRGGSSLELTLAAGGITGNGVLEGGVVAAAIDASGRAGFGGAGGGKEGARSGVGFLPDPRKEVVAAEAESLLDNKKAPTPKGSGGDGVLELRDIALYIDVAAPTAVAEETGSGNGKESSSPLGAKQGVTSFYGCSGSPLGTLSSFGNACGLYGSGYFGGGMLGDTSGFGGGGTIG